MVSTLRQGRHLGDKEFDLQAIAIMLQVPKRRTGKPMMFEYWGRAQRQLQARRVPFLVLYFANVQTFGG